MVAADPWLARQCCNWSQVCNGAVPGGGWMAVPVPSGQGLRMVRQRANLLHMRDGAVLGSARQAAANVASVRGWWMVFQRANWSLVCDGPAPW